MKSAVLIFSVSYEEMHRIGHMAVNMYLVINAWIPASNSCLTFRNYSLCPIVLWCSLGPLFSVFCLIVLFITEAELLALTIFRPSFSLLFCQLLLYSFFRCAYYWGYYPYKMSYVFVCLLWDQVSCSPGWLLTWFIAKVTLNSWSSCIFWPSPK